MPRLAWSFACRQRAKLSGLFSLDLPIARRLGLRARFAAILLVALLPSVVVLGFGGWHITRQVTRNAEAQVLAAVRQVAEDQRDVIDSAVDMLAVLGETTGVRHFEPDRCMATLAGVKLRNPWMAGLFAADGDGRVRCADRTLSVEIDIAAEPYFRDAVSRGTASIGDYAIGPVTGRPVIPIAHPVYDAGRLEAVVLATVDLGWLARSLTRTLLPEGSVAFVVQDDGRLISGDVASPPAGSSSGVDPARLLHAFSRASEGVVEVSEISPVARLYGFSRLDPGGIIAVVGIPKATLLAPVREWVLYWIVALLGSVSLGLPLAFVAAELLVLRTARRISAAARQLAAGRNEARTGLASAPGELGELARQFDEMAESLSLRTAELERARDRALRADHAKNEFLARMSHELRTPLNAIIGFSEVIRDQTFGRAATGRYSDYANDIHTSGQHLLSLINELLDLARIESGKLVLQREALDVEGLLHDCVKLTAGLAEAHWVHLKIASCEPGLLVDADPRALRQILLNLISNAVKYTQPEGRVSIAAFGAGNESVIEIRDGGIGMTPEQIEQAFQPFERNDDPLVRSREGTGLGLPIARQLAELHGGRLTLESRRGVGTRVRVILPRILPAASPSAPAFRSTVIGEIGQSPPSAGGGVTERDRAGPAALLPIRPIGRHVEAGVAAGNQVGDDAPGDRPVGQAQMMMAEGEPDVAVARRGADHRP